MFSISSFIGVSVIGLLAYWAAGNISFFLVACFGSAYLILFMNSLLHYAMNDYNLFQSINDINDRIKAHNKKVTLIKEKTK